MKLKLLPLAIGAAIAMPSVAMAGPTVYGKVNVSLEQAEFEQSAGKDLRDLDEMFVENEGHRLFEDDLKEWELNSNASRLGFKGTEEINDDLSVIYQAEYQIEVDDSTTFSQRNIFAGLKGGFGTVKAGKFDSPLKQAQKKIDLFNDLGGDIKNYVTGEERPSNIIEYTTPAFGPVTAKLAIMPGENDNNDDGLGNSDDKNGIADSTSVSVAFEQDNIYVALAVDSEVNSDYQLGYQYDRRASWILDDSVLQEPAFSLPSDTVRLVAQANVAVFQLGFLYQTAENSDTAYNVIDGDVARALDVEQDAFVLSAAMKVGSAGKVKLQYGQSTTDTDRTYFDGEEDDSVFDLDERLGSVSNETEATQIALGYDHKLSKQTKLFVYYNMINYETSKTKGSGDFKDIDVKDSIDADVTNLGFGMEHKF